MLCATSDPPAPGSTDGVEALLACSLDEHTGALDGFPAAVLIGHMLAHAQGGTGFDRAEATLVEHLLGSWADRVANDLQQLTSPSTPALHNIRDHMAASLEALLDLVSLLQLAHAASGPPMTDEPAVPRPAVHGETVACDA